MMTRTQMTQISNMHGQGQQQISGRARCCLRPKSRLR